MLEILNFNDKLGQQKFKEMTNYSNYLSAVFDNNDNIEVQTKRFLKKLNKTLHKCFKKIRIKRKNNSEIDRLFIKRNNLRKSKDSDAIRNKELESVESELADKMAEDLYEIVKDEVEKVKYAEGGFNSGHLWRIKKQVKAKI